MLLRRLTVVLMVLTLSMALASPSEAGHRRCGSYSSYGYGYNGYNPYGGYGANQVYVPGGYGVAGPTYLPAGYGGYGYAPAYGYGAYGAPVAVGYGSPYDGYRRNRNRTRNVLLGVGAAVLLGALLSR